MDAWKKKTFSNWSSYSEQAPVCDLRLATDGNFSITSTKTDWTYFGALWSPAVGGMMEVETAVGLMKANKRQMYYTYEYVV